MSWSDTPASVPSVSSPAKQVKTANDSVDSAREEDTENISMADGAEWELKDEDDDNDDDDHDEDLEDEDIIDDETDAEDRERSQRGSAQMFESFEFAHPSVSVPGQGKTEEEKLLPELSGWVSGDKVNTVHLNKSRRFVCVDYPGVIENPDRAVATLGGLEGIQKAVADNWRLELSFRPRDPFCKPVISTVNNNQHFLLKVRRRRTTAAVNSGLDPVADPFEYQVQMIGQVVKVYTFDKLCDFQYLPVSRQTNGQYTEILSSIIPTFNDDRQTYLSRSVPIFLPPFSFTRREWPITYNFEAENLSQGEKTDQTFIGLDRKKRDFGAHHIYFDYPGVPDSPLPEALANIGKLSPELRDLSVSAVKKLFDQRPVWSRSGLSAHLEPAQRRYLKVVLPVCAYYMVNGPWRALWCKFAYDPRVDPTAKLYQTVDYRVRSVLNRQKVESKRGLDICRFAQVNSQKPESNTAVIPIGQATTADQAELTSNDLVYKFLPDRLPPYRQMRYQACDVHHQDIQRRLHENDGKETTCTERDGWCVPDFTAICRDVLSASVDKLFAK